MTVGNGPCANGGFAVIQRHNVARHTRSVQCRGGDVGHSVAQHAAVRAGRQRQAGRRGGRGRVEGERERRGAGVAGKVGLAGDKAVRPIRQGWGEAPGAGVPIGVAAEFSRTMRVALWGCTRLPIMAWVAFMPRRAKGLTSKRGSTAR